MKQLVGIGVILIAFVVLVASSMKSNTMRSVPVSELRAADSGSKTFVGQSVGVVGFVGELPVRSVTEQTPGGIIKIQRFMVEDENKTLEVDCRGALPETFRAGGPAQVDG